MAVKPGNTRKYKNRTRKLRAANLDVRSDGAVKMLEKAIVNGPLTLVFVKLEGCGPCDRLNQDVWSPLTKLKNRSINLARVDSRVFSKTSLANTPPKFYPTLMVVGKDGKPATFKDKDGNITHSMPRQDTLSEDREVLSSLVQNPTVKSIPELLRANLTRNSPPRADASFNLTHKSPFTSNEVVQTIEESNGSVNSVRTANSVGTANSVRTANSVGNAQGSKILQRSNQMSKQVLSSVPPDIGADLISSKPANLTVKTEPTRGGRLLHALRGKSSSIKALLRLSEPRYTRKYRK